ncbi:SIMPL domain-containing protein [Aquibacillus saliphilus]|uniref:SIMPL domain-containing protein n=1 Tax=Aquibacillus saliphilus TaxID=1909422 RepID=UPI001CF00F06|nr:SIMPL domain-containing protein [Aquibacillus saliphilus]
MYYPHVNQTNLVNNRIVTVYGNGVLSVEPNVSEVELGVVTEELNLKTAQQKNTRLIQQVIQSLINLGVSKENIQTYDYTIHPRYDYLEGVQQFQGYQVTHMLTVTIENLDQTGTIIDTAVANGANRISAINFSVKNKGSYYQQALTKALEDAFTKAETIANAMRLTLDPAPVKILEQQVQQPPIPIQTLSSSEMVGNLSTPIEPGKLKTVANVKVMFYYYS